MNSCGLELNIMGKTSWNTNQWLVWLTPPSIALMLIFIIVGVACEWAVSRTGYWEMQEGLFVSLNARLSELPSALWLNLTMLGDGSIFLLIASPLILWRRSYYIAIIASVPMAGMFSVLGKKLAGVPRPAAVLDNAQFNIVGDTLTAHNSFPSGHTITVFTALVAVAASAYSNSKYPGDSKAIPLVLAIAVVLGLSRVAVGAHWPLDVVGGAALGWLAGLFGAAISRRSTAQWFYSARGTRIMALIIMISSYVLAQRALVSTSTDMPVVWLSVVFGLVTSVYLLGLNKNVPAQPSVSLENA